MISSLHQLGKRVGIFANFKTLIPLFLFLCIISFALILGKLSLLIFFASFLDCSYYSHRSSNYLDSDSYCSFSLYKIEEEQQLFGRAIIKGNKTDKTDIKNEAKRLRSITIWGTIPREKSNIAIIILAV